MVWRCVHKTFLGFCILTVLIIQELQFFFEKLEHESSWGFYVKSSFFNFSIWSENKSDADNSSKFDRIGSTVGDFQIFEENESIFLSNTQQWA